MMANSGGDYVTSYGRVTHPAGLHRGPAAGNSELGLRVLRVGAACGGAPPNPFGRAQSPGRNHLGAASRRGPMLAPNRWAPLGTARRSCDDCQWNAPRSPAAPARTCDPGTRRVPRVLLLQPASDDDMEEVREEVRGRWGVGDGGWAARSAGRRERERARDADPGPRVSSSVSASSALSARRLGLRSDSESERCALLGRVCCCVLQPG